LSTVEKTILEGLVYNDEFIRKVVPYLKEEYFADPAEKLVFNLINDFVAKYKDQPSKEALIVSLDATPSVGENVFKEAQEIIDSLDNTIKNPDWLVDQAEKFCKDKAVYNAIVQSIGIIDDTTETDLDKGAIPKILSDALAVSFDTSVGLDWLEDIDDLYQYYHEDKEKIAFDLDIFNKILAGGMPRKTLNIILAGTGVGKSLMMCHMAAAHMIMGKNVLYISAEMSEEQIGQRIDANQLNLTTDQIKLLPKDVYMKKKKNFRDHVTGRLIVRDFPTATASASHFRYLINELKLKKNFFPDIIYVDYLNICSSVRFKANAAIGSYAYIKAIAEELRGLAMELDVVMVSATQTTRSGFTNSDPGLEDTSESWGLPQTADFMFAMIANEQLDKLGQIMIKQLKNRNNDVNYFKKFVIGVDKSKFKLYDVEQNAQQMAQVADTAPDLPAFDNSTVGQRIDKEKLSTLNI
jgi:replicative DNA helicase